MIPGFTRADPACRKTLAKLRAARFRMRALGIARCTEDAPLTVAAKTDVRLTWARHGWKPVKRGRRAGA